MANDIFGYRVTNPKGFKKQDNGSLISLGGSLKMIQNWNVSFNQNIVPVYDCGSSDVYFVGSNAVGTLTVGRVVGQDAIKVNDSMGTVCSPGTASINMKTGCGNSSGGSKVSLTGVIVTGVGWSGQAQSAVIQENIQIQFSHASY